MKPGKYKKPTPIQQPNVISEKNYKLPYSRTPVKIPSTHRYNTLSRTHQVNHINKFNNKLTFTAWRGQKIKFSPNGKTMTDMQTPKLKKTTVEPTVKSVHCETTGKVLGYKEKIKIDAPVWKNLFATNQDAFHKDGNHMQATTPWD